MIGGAGVYCEAGGVVILTMHGIDPCTGRALDLWSGSQLGNTYITLGILTMPADT